MRQAGKKSARQQESNMRNMLMASAFTMALVMPAYASGASGQAADAGRMTQARAAGTTQPAATADQDNKNQSGASDAWVPVTSAEQLVGRDIQSNDGKQAGSLDGLMVDLSKGDVIYALIASGGDLDIGNDRIVVPYRIIQAPSHDDDSPLMVNQSLDKIKKGKRIVETRFTELSNAEQVPEIYGPYGIAMPYGYVAPPSTQRTEHPYRYVLIRPNGLTMMGAPDRTLAQKIRGSVVQRMNGDTIGTVDQVMINPNNGRIPYLLLSSGGFLGIGNDWVPVPPEAVTWSADKNAFVMNDANVKPEAMQLLHKTDLPAGVQRSELEALYDRFGLQPYWRNDSGNRQAGNEG